MPVWVIARLVLKEASRRRLLLAVAVLTTLLVALTAWGLDRLTGIDCRGGRPCDPLEMRALAATLVILICFMLSSIFTIGAVFLTAPAIHADVESGVLLSILPRPLRRSDLVLGKWLGLAILVCGYAIATTALEFIAVQAVVGYAPPYPLQAIAFLAAQALAVLTLTLLASTRLSPMAGGVVVLVLYGLAWMGGIARGVGRALDNETVETAGAVSALLLPSDGLWRGALYHLQPSLLSEVAGVNRMVAANPFFASTPPSAPYLLWAAGWTAAVLALALWSFQRREL